METAQSTSPFLGMLQARFGDMATSYIDLIRRTAAAVPDKAAFLEPDRDSMTYGQFLQLVERTVKATSAMGLGPDTNVVVAIPSSVSTAAAYIALSCGAAILPVSPGLSIEEYERFISILDAKAIVVQQGFATQARAVAEQHGLILVEIAPSQDGPAGIYEVVGADTLPDVEPQFAGPMDIGAFLHTSGTTDKPKIVPWLQQESMIQGYLGLTQLQGDTGVAVVMMPLYHLSGAGIALFTVFTQSGLTCIANFDVSRVYRYLALYQPQFVSAVPAMLENLVREAPAHEEEIAKLKLQLISVGSAALSDELKTEVERIFKARVAVGYGMSETLGITSAPPGTPRNSVGKPSPITQVLITDEDGTAMPAGESGEITVRSPLMFRGYYRNPEANSEAFRNGWFRTGDEGYFDADGFLYITGRIKEVINRGGSKISPLDVDAVLKQHPNVAEVAAFGFPHQALGEDLAAAIVVKDGELTERDLRLFASQHLPMNKVPSRFVFVSELPKTSVGKIKRTALTQQYGPTLER